MYYETKDVKEYNKKRGNGKSTLIYQINLTNKTKFKDGQTVAIVDAETLNEYIKTNNESNTDDIETYKKQLETLEKENKQLREKLEILPDVIEIQEKHKYELQKLNATIHDKDVLINSLIIAYFELFKRGFFARLLNKTPESYETIQEIKQLPETVLNESDK